MTISLMLMMKSDGAAHAHALYRMLPLKSSVMMRKAMITVACLPEVREIIVQPGRSVDLKITCPMQQPTSPLPSGTSKTTLTSDDLKLPSSSPSGTETASPSTTNVKPAFFAHMLACTLMISLHGVYRIKKVINTIENVFGRDFLTSVLTDGVSNFLTSVDYFGFVNGVAASCSSDPKFRQRMSVFALHLNVVAMGLLLAGINALRNIPTDLKPAAAPGVKDHEEGGTDVAKKAE